MRLPSTTAPNIRIVKFLTNEHGDINKIYLGYFITLGYVKFDITKIVVMHIHFCPGCGQNLKHFYKSADYCNEVEGVTF
jgi:hypothetical protein